MRIAVLLKGISYAQSYVHWSGQSYNVDFRDNADNMLQMLIEPFKEKGDTVDTYCCTYEHEYLHLLNYKYNTKDSKAFPKRRMFDKTYKYVLSMIVDGLDIIKEEYDLYIITRFDVNFTKRVIDIPFDEKDVNFLCKAKGPLIGTTYNDDTLIIVGRKQLQKFKDVAMRLIEENDKLMHHLLYDKLIYDGLGKFMIDESYEIVSSRPHILFNREIDYRPNEIVLNKLRQDMLYTTYKKQGTAIRCMPDGVLEVFKLPQADFEMYYDIVSGTTSIHVSADIKNASGYFGNLVLLCNGQERKCTTGVINETFVVKRGVSERVVFRFDKILPAHILIHRLCLEEVDPTSKIHFVSFYTEGPPYDLCTDMTLPASRYKESISPYVDSVHFFTPKELSLNEKTYKLVAPVEGATPNPYNPGVHNIGFLKWKPYIVLKALEEAGPNDIVYYRDANIAKYPSILDSVHETRSLLKMVLSLTDVFVPIENHPYLKMKKNVKREIFEDLGRYDHEYLESYGYNSSIVICRKSELSMRIMREWLDGCMQDRLINYDTTKQQHPDYGWNVQEQSILNIVLKRNILNGNLPMKYPWYSLNMRHFTMRDLTRVPKVCVLMAGEMRSFDCPDLVKDNSLHLINKLNADVFVSTWDHRGTSFNHGNGSNEGASNCVIKEELYKLYPNTKGINIESYDEWVSNLDPNMRSSLKKGFYNNGSTVLCPNTIYPQLYKVWDANRMKVAYEHKFKFEYDLVIRLRPDTWLLEPIPSENLSDFIKLDGNPSGKLWHMNPPGIYEGGRVYDIFYYGNSHTMNVLADTWKCVMDLVRMPCDLVLPDVSTCRVLYQQAIRENIDVIDIPRSLGDVYRNEPPATYVHKITQIFNRGAYQQSAVNTPVDMLVNKPVINNVARYMPARYLRR